MTKFTLLLSSLFFLLSACSSTNLPTIDEVAKSNMIILQDDVQWRLFKIVLAPNESLGDHRSGSRIILPILPIKIQRLIGEQKPIEVTAYKALWLTNEISKGFKNISHQSMEYLVLEAKDPNKQLIKSPRQCEKGTTLNAFESLMVCKIVIEKPAKFIQASISEGNFFVFVVQE